MVIFIAFLTSVAKCFEIKKLERSNYTTILICNYGFLEKGELVQKE